MGNLTSLVLYLSVFSMSIFFIFVAQWFINKKIIYRLYIFIALFIPSLLAGLRYNVGTDYENYVRIFEQVKNLSYIDFIATKNYEIGFFTLEKLAMLFGNVQWVFFLSSFIMLLFVYLALHQHQDKIPIYLGYAIYIFILFPVSLNAIRQQIAVSVIVFALKYIFEKKLAKFVISCLFASTFHITAIIMIPFYFLFNYSQYKLNVKDKYKIILRLIFLCFIGLFIVNYGYFLNITAKLSGIERFDSYSGEMGAGSNREIILNASILFFILSLKNKLIKFDHRNQLFIYFLIIDFLLNIIGFWNPIVTRIGVYFGVSQIFVIPAIVTILETRLDRYIAGWLVCMYGITYFVLAYYILGHSEIFPYHFKT